MNKYRYNEEEHAKQMLICGFLTKYHFYELKILCKYYREQGIKASKRKELIYVFCEKYMEEFNRVKYFKKINSVLKYGSKKKNKLIIIKYIPITDKEINYINSLDVLYEYKKVLFALLVKYKINQEYVVINCDKSITDNQYYFFGGTNKKYNEIFEMAKIHNDLKINKIINNLSEDGIIEVRTKGKIYLKFMNAISISDNIVMKINTFDNVEY